MYNGKSLVNVVSAKFRSAKSPEDLYRDAVRDAAFALTSLDAAAHVGRLSLQEFFVEEDREMGRAAEAFSVPFPESLIPGM